MAGRRLKQARVLKHPVAPFSVRAFCIILRNFILITCTEKSFHVPVHTQAQQPHHLSCCWAETGTTLSWSVTGGVGWVHHVMSTKTKNYIPIIYMYIYILYTYVFLNYCCCCCCTGIRLCNLVHALNMPRNHKHGRKTTQAARNCIPAWGQHAGKTSLHEQAVINMPTQVYQSLKHLPSGTYLLYFLI